MIDRKHKGSNQASIVKGGANRSRHRLATSPGSIVRFRVDRTGKLIFLN